MAYILFLIYRLCFSPQILKPLKGATYSGSAGRKLVNLNTTAQSFVNRNTPKKKTIKVFLQFCLQI